MSGCLKVIAVALIAAVFSASAFLAGFGTGTLTGSTGVPTGAIPAPVAPSANPPPATPPGEFAVFWEAWNLIKGNFYGKIPEGKAMTYAAIRGVIKALNDPHTVFLEPKSTERESEQLRGDFEGIGAYINVEDGNFVITAPIAGSPAEAAGVKAGDIILKVGEQDVKGMSLDDVVAAVRGPRGTQVALTLFRPGKPDPVVIQVTRDTIKLPSVVARMEQDNIGYVRLTIFGAKSKEDIAAAIQKEPKVLLS